MVNNIRFMISKEEEDLALGPGTKLDHSELLCGRSFNIVKNDRESFLHRCQKGGWRVSHLLVLSRPYILLASLMTQTVKSLPAMQKNCV